MSLNIKELMIAGVLAALLIPVAVEQLVGVNTSTWPATLVTLWGMLPLFLVLAVAIGFIYYAKIRK